MFEASKQLEQKFEDSRITYIHYKHQVVLECRIKHQLQRELRQEHSLLPLLFNVVYVEEP